MQDRTGQTLEDLLMDTLDAVSRFRVGQREAVGGALDAGELLVTAKGRLQHGEWGNWLERVGLNSRTASRWMKLAGMELTAEQIIAQGGIRAVLSGKPRAAKKTRCPICGRTLSCSVTCRRWRRQLVKPSAPTMTH